MVRLRHPATDLVIKPAIRIFTANNVNLWYSAMRGIYIYTLNFTLEDKNNYNGYATLSDQLLDNGTPDQSFLCFQ